MNTLNSSLSATRADRRERLSTRNAVLDAAGRVFAERGFAEATSKEICQLAGANSAAVNYYFGGKEKLYEEVLIEAHRQMSDLEELDKIIASHLPPEEKLRTFLESMLQTATASSELWGIKIFLRELASPSSFVVQNIITTALPKALKLRSLIHEVTGLPINSKKLQWATGFVLIPCISFILFPKSLQSLLLPNDQDEHESLLNAMFTYILSGLHAMKE